MLDYEIVTVPRYDGTGRSTKAVEVFDCMTGETLSVTRSRPFEAKAKWIERAFERTTARAAGGM